MRSVLGVGIETMNTWYEQLNRPALTPPGWVFGPVWTVLYAMIAISILLYYRSPGKQYVVVTTVVLVVHLISNFIWTWLFFRLQSPLLALVDIVVLDCTLLALIALFWQTNRIAAGLLVPYLLWVLFATYLNWGFYRLN